MLGIIMMLCSMDTLCIWTRFKEGTKMAEATRLCPVCRTIMKSAAYKVGKQDGVERLENNIFTPDGVGIIGKLLVCPKCGNLAVVK